jgi:solute carrier family 27 fatty acid transporter 1/4
MMFGIFNYRGLIYLVTTQLKIWSFQRNKKTVISLFKDTVKKFAHKNAFILVDGKEWTFSEVDQYSNKIANVLHDAGIQKGDVVAMVIESKPEYPCMWLGIGKVGGIAALINYNLKQEPLAHSIRSSKAKIVIFAPEFADGKHFLLVDIVGKTSLLMDF